MSEPIGTLTIEFDTGGNSRLVLRGPEIPVIAARPAIGVSRDAEGRYHFAVGADDHVYNWNDLPSEFRRLLGNSNTTPAGSRAPIRMPSCRQLRSASGSFMTYQDYELNRRLFHSEIAPIGAIWPALPPAVYEAMISYCRQCGQGIQPRR